jgi:hypothetical protein
MDFVLSQPEVQEQDGKVTVFGQSIGGAVAIDVAGRNQERVRFKLFIPSFMFLCEGEGADCGEYVSQSGKPIANRSRTHNSLYSPSSFRP